MAKQVDSGYPHGLRRAVVLIGEQIRSERLRQERTLSSLARDSDVPKSYLWRIERCQANPSIKTVLRIADALGVVVVGSCGEPVR